jgi:hypothetical protein
MLALRRPVRLLRTRQTAAETHPARVLPPLRIEIHSDSVMRVPGGQIPDLSGRAGQTFPDLLSNF